MLPCDETEIPFDSNYLAVGIIIITNSSTQMLILFTYETYIRYQHTYTSRLTNLGSRASIPDPSF